MNEPEQVNLIAHADDSPNEGWDKVWTFFDGVTGVAERVAGTVDTVSDASRGVAETKAAWNDVQLDKAEREQSMLLTAKKVDRGDNLQLYYVGAAAAAAVAIILILRK